MHNVQIIVLGSFFVLLDSGEHEERSCGRETYYVVKTMHASFSH